MSAIRSIWQRLDLPGMEWSELHPDHVVGVALATIDAVAYRLDYAIHLDGTGKTRSVQLSISREGASEVMRVHRDDHDHWPVNDEERAELAGCLDVDLGFSPSTNTLPIRRLGLPTGGQATVHAAWLRFPELRFELATQRYERLEERRYRFVQDDFSAVLDVDEDGVVDAYEGLWQRIART